MTPFAYAVDGGGHLRAVRAVDEDGAAGLGPEVDPEGVPAAHGSITTFRPRRSRSDAKASGHSSRAYRPLTRGARSTRRSAASRSARGRSAARMRRDRSSVRPLRLAADARKEVRSSSGMPTRTRRPPGRSEATASSTAPSSPPPRRRPRGPRRARAHRRGRHASRRAPRLPRRGGRARSVATIGDAPTMRRSCTRRRPSGPQPKTPAPAPGRTCPRSNACSATPSGSASAASTSLSVSGTGCTRRSGHARSVRRAPSVGPWPAKRTAGQRCSSPAAQSLAHAARDCGIDGNAFALTRAGRDDARELVPEHERVLELGVADAALEQPVTVRAAETDGGDAHEHLSRRRRRVRLVVQPQLVRPVQPERPQPVCP